MRHPNPKRTWDQLAQLEMPDLRTVDHKEALVGWPSNLWNRRRALHDRESIVLVSIWVFRSSWNRTWRGAVLQEQHSLSGPRPGESTSWVQVPHGTLHPGLSPVAKSSGQAAAPVMSATLPRLRIGTQCQSEAAV
jgi:hypothetical protein